MSENTSNNSIRPSGMSGRSFITSVLRGAPIAVSVGDALTDGAVSRKISGLRQRAGKAVTNFGTGSGNKPPSAGTKPSRGRRGRNGGSGNGFGGNGGSGSSGMSGSGYESSNSNWRSVTTTPSKVKVDYNSGIKSGAIVNPAQKDSFLYSPLYLAHGQILDGFTAGTRVDEFMRNEALLYYRNAIQRRVNFRYDLSETDFISWWEAMSEALQVHYSLDSVMAYHSYPPNRNEGMKNLRAAITPEIQYKWSRLMELLGDYVCPKTYLEYIRFMYQNHSFRELPGSPIYKLVFKDMYKRQSAESSPENTLRLAANLDVAITSLTTMSSVNNKIYAAFPGNVIGTLPPSSSEALVDHNWHTFWRNQLQAYVESDSSSVVKYNYSIASGQPIDTSFQYGMCTSELDGAMYACWSVFDENTSRISPSLFKPWTDFSVVDYQNKQSTSYYDSSVTGGIVGLRADGNGSERGCEITDFGKAGPGNTGPYLPEFNGSGYIQLAQEHNFNTTQQSVSDALTHFVLM